MTQTNGSPPAHFVVIVPGYMGSLLRSRSSGELVWLDLKALLLRDPFRPGRSITRLFETLTYPNDDLEPAGIMDQVVFAPPLFKQEHYNRLVNALVAKGYQLDPPNPRPDAPAVYTFPYDWRQDNRISARQLGRAITGWSANHPGAKAWVIAHSNGGLVARWYIEKEGGADSVGRLFLMGSPWDGAPKAASVLHSGLEIAFLRLFNQFDIGKISRDAIRTFPSFYQLVPFQNPFLNDVNNEKVDLFEDLRWVENDRHAQMLLDGRRFNQELGNNLSVETLCFFGSRKPTTTFGRVTYAAGGRWERIDWDVTESGDGTVPERSAVHPNAAQKLPFVAGHGDIYVNPAVLEKLDWEMERKYRLGVLAEAEVGNYHIQFEPEQDAVNCGEEIGVWVTIHELGPDGRRTPVFGVPVRAELILEQAFEDDYGGWDEPPASIELFDSAVEPGRYEGRLWAPYKKGYHRLVCTLNLPGRSEPLQMEELILIEGEIPPMASAAGDDQSDLEQAGPTRGIDLGSLSPGDDPGGFAFGGVMPGELMPEMTGSEPPGEFASPALPAAPTETPVPKRFISTSVLDHPDDQPLPMDQAFTLAFWVDPQRRAAATQVEFQEAGLFPTSQPVTLKIFVTSSDFNVYTSDPQSLHVAHSGRSKNTARFDMEPLHPGEGQVMAYIFKENNFVQGLQLTLNVGEATGGPAISAVESLGRPMDSAFVSNPRDLSIVIRKNANDDTYHFLLVGSTVSEVDIKLSDHMLNALIEEARQKMLEVVYLWEDAQGQVNALPVGSKVPPSIKLAYQVDLKIPPGVAREGLVRMARAGHRLYEGIFFSDGANLNAIAMGKKLRQLLLNEQYQLQIVSQDFMMPWGLLYLIDGKRFDSTTVKAENFVGFRHIVEHIPLQNNNQVTDPRIKSEPVLEMSINFDAGIDAQFGVSAVASQLAYFRGLPASRVHLGERKTAQEFLDALSDSDNRDQILYFYGHAVSQQLGTGGPGSSSLQLSNKSLVTINDLKDARPIDEMLTGAPLVFINACESAELSPLFYGGFMPYFVDRGARGVIGTECQVPVRFGDAWARRFFEEFLRGNRPIGEIFLDLRREFLEKNNNILGLLYALYCDGDTCITPGIS